MIKSTNKEEENFIKKLLFLVDKMTLNEKENIKTIKKNLNFIKKFLKKYALLNSLVDLNYNNDKILLFIETLDTIYKDKNIYYNDFFKTDDYGNNFLLLACNSWDIKEILKLLDIVFKNRSYQFTDKILNHKNNFDISFLYKYIDVASNKDDVDFNHLLTLFDSYIFNCDITATNGKTIFDLINENNKKMINMVGWKRLKTMIYWYTVNNSFYQLNGDKKHDTEIVEKLFGNVNYTDSVGSPLHYFVNGGRFDYNSLNLDVFEQMDKKIILDITKKLLDIGINPNVKDELRNETFIHPAIEAFSSDSDFIIDLIKLAQNYNYDVNTTPSLVKTSLEKTVKKRGSYEFTYNIYRHLCTRGLITITADFDIEKINQHVPALMFDTYLYKITNLYKVNYAIESLINNLNNFNLTVEDIFKPKYIWMLDNDRYIDYFIQSTIEFYDNDTNNNTNLISNWALEIKKQRDANISVLDKPVTFYESLEVLKKLIFEYKNATTNGLKKKKIYKKRVDN